MSAKKHTSKLIKAMLDSFDEIESEKIYNRMRIAVNIDKNIRKRKLSKSEFAANLDKNPSEISKWLSGSHNFTIDTLTEISSFFKISISDLTKEINITIVKSITTNVSKEVFLHAGTFINSQSWHSSYKLTTHGNC